MSEDKQVYSKCSKLKCVIKQKHSKNKLTTFKLSRKRLKIAQFKKIKSFINELNWTF